MTVRRKLSMSVSMSVLALVVVGCSTGSPAPFRTAGASEPTAVIAAGSTALVSHAAASAAHADPHEAATVRHVEQALAATPHFPGATRLAAPEARLADPPGMSRPPTYVQRTGWWLLPSRPAAFRTWLLAHLPPTWSLPGGDFDTPAGTWGADGFLDQFSAGPRSDALWTYSAVDVYWVPSGTGTAVRVTAQADWVATRSPEEKISDAANTVDVRVFVPDGTVSTTAPIPPTVHRTLTGSNAAALRTLVNALNPWTDTGLHGCLAEFGVTDVLTFRGGGASTTLITHGDGCTGTSFVSGHRTFPALEDSVLHARLVAMLSLPASYADYW